MQNWVLIDCREPVENEDPFPRTVITSEEQLREKLVLLGARSPSIVHLKNTTGETLIIGIGGALSGLMWMKAPMIHNFKMAVNMDSPPDFGVNFRDQGTDTGFRARNLFNLDEAIRAAIYFYQ